jgi:hypothetical protein
LDLVPATDHRLSNTWLLAVGAEVAVAPPTIILLAVAAEVADSAPIGSVIILGVTANLDLQ